MRLMLRRAAWLVVSWCAVASTAHAQDIDREYRLKAAYLYKFGTYVKWPKKAFRNADSPFVIGILGPNPVGEDLRKIASVKSIDGRPIQVRNWQQANQIRDCHILFMSRAVPNKTQQATIKALSRRHILFVGETKDFLKNGGVVDFVVQQNRVRIYISQPAYKREKLDVSAHLLRIATVMK